MRVKKKVTATVERKVAALLLEDNEYSGEYLKREVEKALKKEGKNYSFTARTYSSIKKRILPNIHSDNVLDQKWSMGACEKFNIPDSMVPLLMEFTRLIWKEKEWEKQFDNLSDDEMDMAMSKIPIPEEFLGHNKLTIREARWMSWLRPLVEKLTDKYKDDTIDDALLKNVPLFDNSSSKYILQYLLYDIAGFYAFEEEIDESLGHKKFDSSEIDEILFVKEYAHYSDFHMAMNEGFSHTDKVIKAKYEQKQLRGKLNG